MAEYYYNALLISGDSFVITYEDVNKFKDLNLLDEVSSKIFNFFVTNDGYKKILDLDTIECFNRNQFYIINSIKTLLKNVTEQKMDIVLKQPTDSLDYKDSLEYANNANNTVFREKLVSNYKSNIFKYSYIAECEVINEGEPKLHINIYQVNIEKAK